MKARLDDELEGLVEELLAKYPPGVCNLHPDKACFHHRVLDLHFDLERARLLVWSAAIVCVIQVFCLMCSEWILAFRKSGQRSSSHGLELIQSSACYEKN